MSKPIVLFTDFGVAGPYIGQMKGVLARLAPDTPAINLFADVPSFDPVAGAYLLAAYYRQFEPGTVFLCVVDPGVGSNSRLPEFVEADGYDFVGPGNGIFNMVIRGSKQWSRWEITWQPQGLSSTFHGRDLFAPIAAWRAAGVSLEGKLRRSAQSPDRWPADYFRVIYIDHYGNAMTGIRAETLVGVDKLDFYGECLPRAKTFSDMPPGAAFWYCNANGLVELAVNRGSFRQRFHAAVGDEVAIA